MIDNLIDNGWISILQQFEIQPFNFFYLCDMIDKPPKGLDKLFFVWRNAILLQCKQKKEAMKKLFTIITLTILGINAFAYDFYAVCPSGQTLYYNVISLNEKTVAITYYEHHWNSYEYYETYYYGASAPSGDVIIPEAVESHGILFTVVEVDAASLPNPTYRITNVNGQNLLTGTLSVLLPQYDNTTTIDVSSLPAGLYFISVGEQTVKFIVK